MAAVAKPKNAVSREPRALSGRQKAAVLCLTLGSETAAKITQRLAPEEAEAISYEMARLDSVPADVVENVLGEWLEYSLAIDSLSVVGLD